MYTLNLTKEDLDAICWTGDRYGWSASLLSAGLEEGQNEMEEHVAWEIVEGCESDDSYFPCLSSASNLASELYRLIEDVV